MGHGNGLVEQFRGLFGHAEAARSQTFGHIFTGATGECHLKIMDDAGAIHGQMGDHSFVHEINQDGCHAGFDHMPTHAKADVAIFFCCTCNGVNHTPDIFSRKNGG